MGISISLQSAGSILTIHTNKRLTYYYQRYPPKWLCKVLVVWQLNHYRLSEIVFWLCLIKIWYALDSLSTFWNCYLTLFDQNMVRIIVSLLLKVAKLFGFSICSIRVQLATKREKVEWEARTGMWQWSTSTFENSCGCTAPDMSEWRKMTEQSD